MAPKIINNKVVPEGATHHHSMGTVTLFYKRVDLYKKGDLRKWLIWGRNNKWSEAMVKAVGTQPNGTPHGFEAINV